MQAVEAKKPSPIIVEASDQQAMNSCSVDSPCALTPKDRVQMAAMAILGIGIMSLFMYGLYWLAMKFA